MRQFFDAYRDRPDLSTLLRELPWSANLHVLTKCKRSEEREFYLRMAARRFLAELGRDFCFIGSEVPLQVGSKDFVLDLLFFHRELACLIALELLCGAPHKRSSVASLVMWRPAVSALFWATARSFGRHINSGHSVCKKFIRLLSSRQRRTVFVLRTSQSASALAFMSRSISA
jgi:YhcG PDDEXK nuclease domain/DUF1016 N-terminal domain